MCRVLHAHQQHHQQLTHTGHSCQSHTIQLVIWNLSDLDFDADNDIHVQHDDVPSLGKPVGFSTKRGLLFSAPGGTTLDPPPASLAEAVHLDGGIGKGFMLSTALPLCIGQSLRAGTAGDEMICGKLPFTSPHSNLVCAQSSTALDLHHNHQPSGNIHNFLGSGPSRSKHRRAGLCKIDTISPTNMFGSSLPCTVSAPNVETKLG
ncbi:uncharacterized protein UBRO_20710 [Ustilago bromivora]|uniref:Uncharacterized protein n=1 Tax=Ustilago bromivora TaxID=307758 RepID=A0A1K0G551_9BASI|nr:uncharacterized protein UBRO_20710 [Ustilago bromivora]